MAKLKKAPRVGGREDYWVCGGTCWGNYLAMDQWERLPCGLCISWYKYTEKLKLPGHQRSPFGGPTADGAIALASQDSASAMPVYIAYQGVVSGKAGIGLLRGCWRLFDEDIAVPDFDNDCCNIITRRTYHSTRLR